MKQIIALVAALIMGASPAFATGGFSCSIDDSNLKLDVESTTSRGMGLAIIQILAKADLKADSVPADFKTIDFSEKLVHSWLAGPDVKLYFYTEREGAEPFVSIELILQTTGGPDDEELKGTYSLSIYDPSSQPDGNAKELTGKAVCTTE